MSTEADKKAATLLQAFDKGSCFFRDVGRSPIDDQKYLVLSADNQSERMLDNRRELAH
jgi:hypothetical protein